MDPAEKKRTLEAYTTTYLKEEILNEAVIRNLTAFSKFLEIAANCNGEIVNYSTIARDTGVASKTIKEYYQILEDTLIAFQLNSYSKSIRKQLILHPKYYFFDPGIVNSLCGRINLELKQSTYLYGQLFEHFIILELQRLIKYYEKSWKVYFWKTIHKAEVDVIIEIDSHTLYAVEIKSALYVTPKDLRGLKSFKKHFPKAKAFCVLRAEKPYAIDDVSFLPWKYFFEEILGLIS